MPMAYNETCMHEFVMSLGLKQEKGIIRYGYAKGLLDYGIHPPTMYFPLIVHEALMVEPTETESRETLDEASRYSIGCISRQKQSRKACTWRRSTTPVTRLDEVGAARHPVLKYEFEE